MTFYVVWVFLLNSNHTGIINILCVNVIL